MRIILIRWLINVLALLLISHILHGFHVASVYSAVIAALILGLVNALVRPILFILTLPITIITLGLFTLVLNALMIVLTASIVKGFSVDSFGVALVAALLFWLVGFITNVVLYSE